MTEPSFLKNGKILIITAIIGAISFILWAVTRVEATKEAPPPAPEPRAPAPESAAPARPTKPSAPKPGKAQGPIDVLLVVVDTERADVTTPYGAKLPTTPFFAELARQGVLFSKAFTTAPWTVPAMYSMITALNPSEHGIDHGAAGNLKDGKIDIVGQSPLPEEADTLAEMLKRHGYTTFGVCTNLHLSKRFGFAQGFDHFVGEKFEFLPFPNVALASLVPQIRAAKKYFLWLHYFDPHLPYYTDGSVWFHNWNKTGIRSFPDLAFELVIRDYRRRKNLAEDAPVHPEDIETLFYDWQSLVPRIFSHSDIWFEALKPLEQHHKELFRTAYLGNIRQVDDAMKEAFEKLDIDSQTLVVVTSDHGEELFKRSKLGHHHAPYWSLYQELLHVPLLILLPGHAHAGTVVDSPVSIMDIVPTITDVLGIEATEPMSGKSLLPLMEGTVEKPRKLFAEVSYPRAQGRALIQYPWKYILAMKSQKGKLYNLESDPSERHNLILKEPERAAAMAAQLTEYIENTKPRWPVKGYADLTPEEIEQLKTLGYMR
jgi:arylsulfatase A-like enzyme